MIEINLLPEERRRKKESRISGVGLSGLDFKKIPMTGLAAGAGVFLAALPILLFALNVFARSNLASLEAQYSQLKSRRKEAEGLKIQADAVNKKIKAIDELMVKTYSWSQKLNDLSDSVPAGIWLSELLYDEKVSEKTLPVPQKGRNDAEAPRRPAVEKVFFRQILLSGFATGMGEEGTALVGKFIKALKDNSPFFSDFHDIELGAIKRDKVEDQEVMSFRITCLFREAK
jgi:hypothetical protein